VVDDPITNVDNIQRHIRRGALPPREATLAAVAEVLPPVIMSTLAIIVSFVPMFFITGMMGPYMAPMAANVPLTVTFSTVAALTVVPWLAPLLLRHQAGADAENAPRRARAGAAGYGLHRAYARLLGPRLDSPGGAWPCGPPWSCCCLVLVPPGAFGSCRLRCCFDNKNEFKIVVTCTWHAPGCHGPAPCALRDFCAPCRGGQKDDLRGTASPMISTACPHYLRRAATWPTPPEPGPQGTREHRATPSSCACVRAGRIAAA
jgi:hypothetical protein